jgi:hypothetical protein
MVEGNLQQQTAELTKRLEMMKLQQMDSGLLFLVLGLVSFELEKKLNTNTPQAKGRRLQ